MNATHANILHQFGHRDNCKHMRDNIWEIMRDMIMRTYEIYDNDRTYERQCKQLA